MNIPTSHLLYVSGSYLVIGFGTLTFYGAVEQLVSSPPFQGGNPGSSPGSTAKKNVESMSCIDSSSLKCGFESHRGCLPARPLTDRRQAFLKMLVFVLLLFYGGLAKW